MTCTHGAHRSSIDPHPTQCHPSWMSSRHVPGPANVSKLDVLVRIHREQEKTRLDFQELSQKRGEQVSALAEPLFPVRNGGVGGFTGSRERRFGHPLTSLCTISPVCALPARFVHHRSSLCTPRTVCALRAQFVHSQKGLCTFTIICAPPKWFVHHYIDLCTPRRVCAP